MNDAKRLSEEFLQHLLDINAGTCRLTPELIATYDDKTVRDSLQGLLILFEDIQYRERKMRAQTDELAKREAEQRKLLAELEDRLQLIEAQRNAIQEMSTPVIEIWDRVLCLPVVGLMDSARSAETTDALTSAVVRVGAEAVIVDITGIEVMDTSTANHFIQMANSIGLLGATCAITGISPAIAQTLVQLDINFSTVLTYRSLRSALEAILRSRRKASNGRAASDKERPRSPR